MAAARLARSAAGAARLRPFLPITSRTIPAVSATLTTQQTRSQSNVPSADPKTQAQSLIDSLPGESLAAKTGIVGGVAGLSAWAISNELYVVNEESIIAFSLLSIFWAVAHYGGPMYKEWAEGHNNKVRGLLEKAREGHTDAVKQRVESVRGLGGVVDITRNLFAVSKETAQLEAQAYELEQKTQLAHEAKAVLDSWVRYEGQVKERQQKELAASIIAKVDKELEDPKVLKRILDQAVGDVERILSQAK